jgi:hypothetical protein
VHGICHVDPLARTTALWNHIMSAVYKKWMMFVDGENLTIRAQEVAKQQAVSLSDKQAFPVYMKDVYFWPTGCSVNHHGWVKHAHAPEKAERCYYYTCTQGDKNRIDEVRLS